MQVGAVTESVNVVGAASVVETDSSEHGLVVNSRQVVELPLNGRNYADLALLATNTIKSPMAVSFSPSGTPREAAFNVNGMRSTYNNFLLDGLDNNAYSPSNQGYSSQVVQPSPDAIAEFKVITNNYSAEYGRTGGAVINAVMSGGLYFLNSFTWGKAIGDSEQALESYAGVSVVSGSAGSQGSSQRINTYFAGYTFTTPSATSPFSNLGRDAFRSPGLWQWDLSANKTFHIRERVRLRHRPRSARRASARLQQSG